MEITEQDLIKLEFELFFHRVVLKVRSQAFNLMDDKVGIGVLLELSCSCINPTSN